MRHHIISKFRQNLGKKQRNLIHFQKLKNYSIKIYLFEKKLKSNVRQVNGRVAFDAMKHLTELKPNATYRAQLIFRLANEQIDLTLAVEVGAVLVEDRVDWWCRYAAEYESLSIEFGVTFE